MLVDEAYLRYHSSQNLSAASQELSAVLNLSRQRDQTIIFVSQQSRQVDRNIAGSADVVVFKDLGMLQLEFDRRELGRIARQAKKAFEAIEGDRKRWSYVCSLNADFIGMMENLLPTFWSDRLSRAFASCGEALTTKLPRKTTLEERIRKAQELSQSGLSFGQIARMLGVSRGTAYNYVRGYPYTYKA